MIVTREAINKSRASRQLRGGPDLELRPVVPSNDRKSESDGGFMKLL